jgi:hypothetical protein
MIAKPIVDRIPIKSHFIKLILGATLTAIVVSLGFSFGLALSGFGDREPSTLSAVGAALGALSGAVFGVRYKMRVKSVLDERLVSHRNLATRWAAIVGILIMSGWTLYDFCFHRFVRWDLIIIMGTMSLSQWIAMIFYGKKN